MKNLVVLIIEDYNREILGKLFLALKLQSEGYTVVITYVNTIHGPHIKETIMKHGYKPNNYLDERENELAKAVEDFSRIRQVRRRGGRAREMPPCCRGCANMFPKSTIFLFKDAQMGWALQLFKALTKAYHIVCVLDEEGGAFLEQFYYIN